MNIDRSIFRSYDIRGIYPTQINEESVYAISKAYANLMRTQNPDAKLEIVVAGDGRLSSPSLKKEVIRGLRESGMNVVDLGLASTPTFFYACARYGYAGGIQVSASHSTKEWNGLKPALRNGGQMSKNAGILELYKMVTRDDFLPISNELGTLRAETHILEEKITWDIEGIDRSNIKPLRVVADPGNGMGALDIKALFDQLPCTLIPMNFFIDGTFPAHEANPVNPENVADLKKRVVAEHADFGIATDGDADRIMLIDEQGVTVPSFALHGILSSMILKRHHGSVIAADLRLGWDVRDLFNREGGKLIVTPVGSALIKERMRENNALFGGEMSGHFFFSTPWGIFESPPRLIAMIIECLSRTDRPLSALAKKYNQYAHSGEVNIKVTNREEIEKKLSKIKDQYKDGEQTFLDGITVTYPDYWFNARASNTGESVMRITLQARTQEHMREELDTLLSLLK